VALKDIKLGKGGKKKTMSRRTMPVKRSINLATTGEKPINLAIAIPAIALILAAAILLSKFFVVDRLVAMSRAQGEVAALQTELDEDYEKLEGFEELTDRYAHYTYSGMTQEEMQRTDRVKVLKLIQKVVIPQAQVSNWTVVGNLLTLSIARSSLQEINLLAQQLNENKLVDYCTVTTATTGNRSAQAGDTQVSAQILVYLAANSDEEDDGEEGENGDAVENAVNAVTDTVVDAVAGDIVDDLKEGKKEVEANEIAEP
jgi:hypothetical protein